MKLYKTVPVRLRGVFWVGDDDKDDDEDDDEDEAYDNEEVDEERSGTDDTRRRSSSFASDYGDNNGPAPTPVVVVAPDAPSVSLSVSVTADGDAPNRPVKLLVGQVPRNLDEPDLVPIFSQYGTLTDVSIIRD